MAKAQAVKVIEKLEKEIAELEASNVAPAAAEKSKKAVDSDKTKTDVSPLESIGIEWHEGTGEFDGKTVKTWSELQHILTSIYNNAFKNHGDDGGYEKVKVLFKWKNGKSIGDRIDVGNGGGDFNPTREKIGDYLKKQQGAMYTSNLQKGERPTLSWEDSATKPQRKAAAKKKPMPKAPEKKIKEIDMTVAKAVEPKGGVAKRVANKSKMTKLSLLREDIKVVKGKEYPVTIWKDENGKEYITGTKMGTKVVNTENTLLSGFNVLSSEDREKLKSVQEAPKRTKRAITSTKRKKAAATETPKRKKKVITSAKRKKAAMVDVPSTKRGLSADKKREALPVGKRVSAAGNTYYEYRRNRADRNAKRKFAKGGEVDNTPLNLAIYTKGGDKKLVFIQTVNKQNGYITITDRYNNDKTVKDIYVTDLSNSPSSEKKKAMELYKYANF
jgi:hypothetical protein